ncbi:hypothetical protein [Vallitalea maricola]|uniref:Uncharacterized protein n=1 Tax=Vallitalea maricola TaxID=3074433 RepID=A0ACB5UGU2_9FIRM|nr:hypothetical protein AN2V17_13160 [Vallitalea sp. AN17-2]
MAVMIIILIYIIKNLKNVIDKVIIGKVDESGIKESLFSNFCFQGLIVGEDYTSKKSLGIHKSDDFVYSYG